MVDEGHSRARGERGEVVKFLGRVAGFVAVAGLSLTGARLDAQAGRHYRRRLRRCGWTFRIRTIPFTPTRLPWCLSRIWRTLPRVDALIKDGVLELSLQDAIQLALENNLDLAIARYNFPIAEADVLRTQAGGSFRGVNTGVVQNTPGGGVGGFGSGAGGAGAGGTSGGAGGAGSGASGLVQSTLGTGTNVSSYDPSISGTVNAENYSSPQSSLSIYGTPTLQQTTTQWKY